MDEIRDMARRMKADADKIAEGYLQAFITYKGMPPEDVIPDITREMLATRNPDKPRRMTYRYKGKPIFFIDQVFIPAKCQFEIVGKPTGELKRAYN